LLYQHELVFDCEIWIWGEYTTFAARSANKVSSDYCRSTAVSSQNCLNLDNFTNVEMVSLIIYQEIPIYYITSTHKNHIIAISMKLIGQKRLGFNFVIIYLEPLSQIYGAI